MSNGLTLASPRLILRQFNPDDYDAVHAYASVYENVRYMGWGPNTPEDTRNFIAETMKKALAEPRLMYDFAVVLKETGALIGGCGIYLNSERFQGMVGWILHRDFWKKGYGTELCAELLRFGFETLGLHRIYATCYTDNYGSYRVMERNGMRREACFKEYCKGRPTDDKKWYDEYVYALLKDEWTAKNAGA